jgi:dTMP kinase
MVFIVIEGIDGAGKTTQAKYLCERLTNLGYEVINEKEPTDGAIGKFIRRALQDKVNLDLISLQLLFVADRNEHMKALDDKIRNKIVISDRYYYSTIAYGEASGMDREYLEGLNSIFPKPDKTFFLELDPKTALKRINSGRSDNEIFEKLPMLEKIKKAYDKFNGSEVERIEANAPTEIITSILLKKTIALLDKTGIQPSNKKAIP